MQIENMLKEHIVEVTFTKTDGTKRVMNATLKDDIIPSKAVNHSPNLLTVYDTEANGWRSLYPASVLDHKIVD